MTLELNAPDTAPIEASLDSIGFDPFSNNVRVICGRDGPNLRACLDTPKGPVSFDSTPTR